MKKILIFFLITTNIIYGSIEKTKICGSAKITKKKIPASNFDKIEIISDGFVYLRQTNKESICIEADQNVISKINHSVINKELQLNTLPDKIESEYPVKYYINFKNLSSLKLSGAICAQIDKLKNDKFNMEVYGKSKIEANFEVKRLKVSAFGSSELNFFGQADTQNLEIFASAKYNAINLLSNEIKIDGYGTSVIELNAKSIINGSLWGFSKILYKHDPIIKIEKFDNSEIKKIELE